MKNILITHDCFVNGNPASAGEVLTNVDNSTAAQLLTSGRATLDLSKPKPEKVTEKSKGEIKPAKKAAKKTSKKKD